MSVSNGGHLQQPMQYPLRHVTTWTPTTLLNTQMSDDGNPHHYEASYH